MGIKKYRKGEKTFWRVNTRITFPNGKRKRFKKAGIPSKEMAVALENKMQIEAFEGRFFDRLKENTLTIPRAWKNYEPVSKRHRSSKTEANIARILIRHLASEPVMQLTVESVEQYRSRRSRETTRTGNAPAPATLDREVEMLKRILNYATACGHIPHNPLAAVKLLRVPNARRTVVDEEKFKKLRKHADGWFKPILDMAYETGMRREEILDLRSEQVFLREGVIRLAAQDTKTQKPRTIIMTDRVMRAIQSQPRHLSGGHVFRNPRTGKRWNEIRLAMRRAADAAGLGGLWFHDLRRSFVTNARRRGIPESVVMQMSGHKTREVFERYNIIGEQDLRQAAKILQAGREKELSELKKVGGDGGN